MDEIPDKNLFMMCPALDRTALSTLAPPYRVRTCRPDELALWKAMPFDGAATAADLAFMDEFFQTTYAGDQARFYASNLLVCDERDHPVATCMLWKAYGQLETIHWFKVVKDHEGRGLGRALLSIVMQDLGDDRYPIYLHTQPGSYRAIKLYSDFGFDLLSGDRLGSRSNDLEECLPILRQYMPAAAFAQLRVREAPEALERFLDTTTTIQF